MLHVTNFAEVGSVGDGNPLLWLVPGVQAAAGLARFDALLTNAEQARAARFRLPQDRARYVVAHGLLRSMLGQCLGLPPADVPVVQPPGGKPVLAGGGPCFNLSHSGDWVVLGLATAAIGVDIEMVHPIPQRAAIIARYFAPAEAAALAALPRPEQEAAFFACWTRKEAYVKATGAGLSAHLSGFEVSVDPCQPAALQTIAGSAAAAAEWTLWGERVGPDAWAAAALHQPAAQMRVRTLLLAGSG